MDTGWIRSGYGMDSSGYKEIPHTVGYYKKTTTMNTVISQLQLTMRQRFDSTFEDGDDCAQCLPYRKPSTTNTASHRHTQPTPALTFDMVEITQELYDLRDKVKCLEAQLADEESSDDEVVYSSDDESIDEPNANAEIVDAQWIEKQAIAHVLSMASIADAVVIGMQCIEFMSKINNEMDKMLEQLQVAEPNDEPTIEQLDEPINDSPHEQEYRNRIADTLDGMHPRFKRFINAHLPHKTDLATMKSTQAIVDTASNCLCLSYTNRWTAKALEKQIRDDIKNSCTKPVDKKDAYDPDKTGLSFDEKMAYYTRKMRAVTIKVCYGAIKDCAIDFIEAVYEGDKSVWRTWEPIETPTPTPDPTPEPISEPRHEPNVHIKANEQASAIAGDVHETMHHLRKSMKSILKFKMPTGVLTYEEQTAKEVWMVVHGLRGTKAEASIKQLLGKGESFDFGKWHKTKGRVFAHPDKGGSSELFQAVQSIVTFRSKGNDKHVVSNIRKLVNGEKTKKPTKPVPTPDPTPEPTSEPIPDPTPETFDTPPSFGLCLTEDQVAITYTSANDYKRAMTKKEIREEEHTKFVQQSTHTPIGGFNNQLPYNGWLMRVIIGQSCFYFKVVRKGNHRYVYLNCNEKVDFTPKKHMSRLLDLCK